MDINKIKKDAVLRMAGLKVVRMAECGPAPYDAELRNVNYGKKVQRGEIDPINLKSRNGSDNITNQQALEALRDIRRGIPTTRAEPRITKGIHSKL